MPLSKEAFTAIARDGAMESRGMPKFEEFSDEDIAALQHYIRDRARYEPSIWEQIKSIAGFIWLMIKMELAKHGW